MAAAGAVGRACVWAGVVASISRGEPATGEILAAGFSGGAGIRDELARSCASGANGICVYGAEHQLGDGDGAGAGLPDQGQQEIFVSDQRGHGDLRRERDCGGRADCGSQRGRDGGVAGDRFYSELRGAFAVSGDWIGSAHEPDAVRIVVGTGDSRHQFGGGSDRQVWAYAVGGRDNEQAGEGPSDGAAVGGDFYTAETYATDP